MLYIQTFVSSQMCQYSVWNMVSNYRSIISVIATFIFLDVLYIQLTKGEDSIRYIWFFPRFYTDILRSLLERAYECIEWALASPPSPHSFTSLPAQLRKVYPLHPYY